MLSVARLLWLWLLFVLAIVLGWREGRLPRLDTVQGWLTAAFSYVSLALLGALCIVRLLTDPPADVTERDSQGFWASVAAGAVCTAAEAALSLRVLPAVRAAVQRRAAAREHREARERAHEALDTDLLGGAVWADASLPPSRGAASPTGRPAAGGSPSAAGAGAGAAGAAPVPQKLCARKLLRLLTPDWPLLVQASILLAAASICEVLIPHYIGQAVSDIIKGERDGTLGSRPFKGPVIWLIVAAASCAVFSGLRGATFMWIGSRASVRLRQNLFDSLLRQEIGFFDTNKTGELTSRMTQDCQKVSDQVTLNFNVFLRTIVSTVTTLLFMFTLSVELTLVAFVSVPAIVSISKKYGKVMRKLSEATQKALADSNAVAEEGLSTMSTVRSFAAEQLEAQRFGAKLAEYAKLVRDMARFYTVYMISSIMLPQCVTALVLFYGGKLASEGGLDTSSLLSFVFYLQTLNGNFSAMGDFYSNIVQALGAVARVFDLCEREPKIPLEPAGGGVRPVHLQGALQLDFVRFNYPARPDVEVLKGLSIEVPPGRVLALVGPSGNGKSTVIGLLKRLYQAGEGSVTLDGVGLWSYPHHLFHRVVSIVGQEPVLYARTIRENIVFGLENVAGVPSSPTGTTGTTGMVSDEEIEAVARKANAHGFIMDMPEGYSTQVGERGVQLSGGQKQRIAIARALVRKPKVLLLDEATSALDAESEKQVQNAIDVMMAEGSMTVVIIAHRLSTVRNSHKICVIQGGVIVESGTHDELVAAGGAYFQLVQCQLSK